MNQFIVWSMKCHKLTYICIVICKSQRYSNTFFHLPTVRDPNDVLLCPRSRNQCFGLEKQLSKRCYWSNEVIHVATLLLFTSSAPKVVAILLELAKAMNASSTILLMLASKHQGGTVWWMQTVEIRQFKKRNPQTGNYQDCWSVKTHWHHVIQTVWYCWLTNLNRSWTNCQNTDTEINRTIHLDLTNILKSFLHNHNNVFK